VASLGEVRKVGRPWVTPSMGDTQMKVKFFAAEFYKGYWRNDVRRWEW